MYVRGVAIVQLDLWGPELCDDCARVGLDAWRCFSTHPSSPREPEYYIVCGMTIWQIDMSGVLIMTV